MCARSIPDITVLTATGVTLSIRGEGNGINGTEVTFYVAHVFHVHKVEEVNLEVTNLGGRNSDVHSILPTTADDVVHDRRNGGGVEGAVRCKGLHTLHGSGIEQLRNKNEKKMSDNRKS